MVPPTYAGQLISTFAHKWYAKIFIGQHIVPAHLRSWFLKERKNITKLQMHLQMSQAKNDAKYNVTRFAFLLTDSQSCVQPTQILEKNWFMFTFFGKMRVGKLSV